MRRDASWVIDPIKHNDLDVEEFKILQDAVRRIQDKRKREFVAHLDRASRIVSSWPEWKRNALGRLS